MRNQIDKFYGYNDTVSAMISKMCLEAFDRFDIEKGDSRRKNCNGESYWGYV